MTSIPNGTTQLNRGDQETSSGYFAECPYLADDGAFLHPLEAVPNPKLTDRDVMIYSLKAGYGKRGAKIGSRDDEAELFRDDMVAFWRQVIGG